VKKVGTVKRFKRGDRKPVAFVTDRTREAGCEVRSGAARLLVQLVGGDLDQLGHEVDKLICYIGGDGQIVESDVESCSSLTASARVWDLTDALVQQNVDRALAASHRLLEDGEAPHRLLAMVTWQVRQLLELQDSLRRGDPKPKSWARIPHFKYEAATRLLHKQPMASARMLGELCQANHLFNRSRAGDRRVFEALIMEMVGSNKSPQTAGKKPARRGRY